VASRRDDDSAAINGSEGDAMKRSTWFVLFLFVTFPTPGDIGHWTDARAAAAAEALGGSAGDWVFPGEYESHQAMWMLWPVVENKAGFPSTEPIGDMIRAMSGHVHVNLAVQDADDEATAT
jgi:hypothetical protein